MTAQPITFFWFRRDLRLEDNVGLYQALQSAYPVVPLFIFDDAILEHLPKDDARVTFIYESLSKINEKLAELGSSLLVKKGKTHEVWQQLMSEFDIKEVFYNKDYEPYAIKRDQAITELLAQNGVKVQAFKDQVIFEEAEITKADGLPYTVYTPYKNKWLEKYRTLAPVVEYDTAIFSKNWLVSTFVFPALSAIGFETSAIKVKPHNLTKIVTYHETRDFPALDTTSYLSPHLRFGTVSVRKLVNWA
ncbi:MAG: deoxyribodipyrimidine photo-lyase, partial [Flavobacterium sp.]